MTTRRTRGQATTEFALMIPVMLTIFFWLIEATNYLMSLHVTAYAGYASARSLEVCDPQALFGSNDYTLCLPWVDQEVKAPILSGSLWRQTGAGLLTTDLSDTSPWKNDGVHADGVRLTTPDIAQMPYSRWLLNGNADVGTYVPTHLGPSGFDPGLVSHWGQRYTDGTRDSMTDNNQTDSDPTPGPLGPNGHPRRYFGGG